MFPKLPLPIMPVMLLIWTSFQPPIHRANQLRSFGPMDSLYGYSCSVIGEPASISELRDVAINVNKNNNELYPFLKEVKSQLKTKRPITLQRTDPKAGMIAASYRDEANQYNVGAEFIVINQAYFDQLAKESFPRWSEYRKAMYIFILAHECAHIERNDFGVNIGENECLNYSKELLADRKAGEAVGALSKVGFDFFDEILPKFLKDIPGSLSHPSLEYRIMAAKAGWVTSLAKRLEKNPYFKDPNVEIISSYIQEDKIKVVAEILPPSFSPYKYIGIDTDENQHFQYYGTFENNIPNGKGVLIVTDQERNGQELYMGEVRNEHYHGMGDQYKGVGEHTQGRFWNSKPHGRVMKITRVEGRLDTVVNIYNKGIKQ
ncbi:MAG: hypothetical protein AAFW00_10295 [Bacteroidota bacterium]